MKRVIDGNHVKKFVLRAEVRRDANENDQEDGP